MKIVTVNAVDIPDAWFQLLWDLKAKGRKFVVEQGSYVGETRLQYDFVVINIKQCYREPWAEMIPKMPTHCSAPAPAETEYLHQYMLYLLTPAIRPGETYTYGQRISPYIDNVIRILKKTPNTNQACLAVAKPEDILISDPPCLREVSYQVDDGVLNQFINFRSWDLWGGLSVNLAALSILHKLIADSSGLKIGETVATSKGLHVYGYAEKLLRMRLGK